METFEPTLYAGCPADGLKACFLWTGTDGAGALRRPGRADREGSARAELESAIVPDR
jgi:hypothetical protein